MTKEEFNALKQSVRMGTILTIAEGEYLLQEIERLVGLLHKLAATPAFDLDIGVCRACNSVIWKSMGELGETALTTEIKKEHEPDCVWVLAMEVGR